MTVLVWANAGLLEPIMSAEFDRGMAAAMRSNPGLTPEAVENMRRVGLRIGQFAGVFTPIGVLITGTMVWLVGKLFEARQQYRAAIMVAAYAFMPRVLEALMNALQGMFMDPGKLDGRFRVSLGIGRFLDPNNTSPVLLTLLGRIDVFTIWVTVLLAIGLSVTGGVSRRRAFWAAPLIWALGTIPLLVQVMRG